MFNLFPWKYWMKWTFAPLHHFEPLMMQFNWKSQKTCSTDYFMVNPLFHWGDQDRVVQLYKVLGLHCMLKCSYRLFKIEDLREELFLNPSYTECQICPYKKIQKMNLSHSPLKVFSSVSLVGIVFWLNILKKCIEIPNYCLFPTLYTVVLDLGALIFYFK